MTEPLQDTKYQDRFLYRVAAGQLILGPEVAMREEHESLVIEAPGTVALQVPEDAYDFVVGGPRPFAKFRTAAAIRAAAAAGGSVSLADHLIDEDEE